uniref:Uncharacterized protein n=1 Tax=Vitis vinifera TaxID=29760 RepID=F6I3G8_VITVI
MASSAIPFSHLNLHLPLSRASLARADCLATTRCRFPSVTRSCLADASSALLQAAKHTEEMHGLFKGDLAWGFGRRYMGFCVEL